ncbi:hypothetical protein [Microbacterium sp. GXF7504]
MGELDRATEQLERLLHDPMATAVRGMVELTAVSAPQGRGRFQEATIDLLASAPGLAPTPVTVAVVLPVRHWPEPGMRLPARIPPAEPQSLEVDWEPLAR